MRQDAGRLLGDTPPVHVSPGHKHLAVPPQGLGSGDKVWHREGGHDPLLSIPPGSKDQTQVSDGQHLWPSHSIT